MSKERRKPPSPPALPTSGKAARSSAAEYLTFVAAQALQASKRSLSARRAGTEAEAFEVRYEDENIWLTQKMMAALYGVDIRTINWHIKTIYSDGELSQGGNYPKILDSSTGGLARGKPRDNPLQPANDYRCGVKVDNERAVQFRKWAGDSELGYLMSLELSCMGKPDSPSEPTAQAGIAQRVAPFGATHRAASLPVGRRSFKRASSEACSSCPYHLALSSFNLTLLAPQGLTYIKEEK